MVSLECMIASTSVLALYTEQWKDRPLTVFTSLIDAYRAKFSVNSVPI